MYKECNYVKFFEEIRVSIPDVVLAPMEVVVCATRKPLSICTLRHTLNTLLVICV